MNNKPENDSCKDITADLREDARQIRRAREIATRMEPQPTMRGRFLDEIFTAYADRLDAVAKPETVYNMAAMREALSTAIILLKACEWPDDTPMQDVAEVMDEIEKAFFAPPRNCDKYDHRYWVDEFEKQMGKSPSRTADEQDEYMRKNWFLFYHWLCDTAKEGGAK